MEWVVLFLYLAAGAGIVWQGFYKRKTILSFIVWDAAIVLYTALVVLVMLMYVVPGIIFLLLFAAFAVQMIGLPIPWFLIQGSAVGFGTAGLQGVSFLALVGGLGVVASIWALKNIKQNRSWSIVLFSLAGLSVVSAVVGFFMSRDVLESIIGLLFSVILSMSAWVLFRYAGQEMAPTIAGDKKRAAPMLVAFGVIALVVVGIVVYNKMPTVTSLGNPLKDSDTAALVTFLKQNNMQAAVVQQIYKPNNASVWIIKADGEKILLYSKDLGTYTSLVDRPRYNLDIDEAEADGTFLLPGNQAAYDSTLKKTYDISKYVTGNSSDVIPYNDSRSEKIWGTSAYGYLSPNAQYSITYPYPGMELNSVAVQNGKTVPTPYAPIPASAFISWSPDSNYILLRKKSGVDMGLDVYDIRDKKTTYMDVTLGGRLMDGNAFSAFLYPSTILFSKQNGGGHGGVFALNFADSDQNIISLAPNEIKMVGLIPDNVSASAAPIPNTVSSYTIIPALDPGIANPNTLISGKVSSEYPLLLGAFQVSASGPEGIKVNKIVFKTGPNFVPGKVMIKNMYLIEEVSDFYKADETFATIAANTSYTFTFKNSSFYIPPNGNIRFTLFANFIEAESGNYNAPITITDIEGTGDQTNAPASFSGTFSAPNLIIAPSGQ